ncbi:MAG TPA: hydrogenase maturation protease [Opitutaceae bacterium]|nr:hydrogenase maturation protease [Opitutaceae bacterium]
MAPEIHISEPAGLLVIGYGNELRGDDAVGPRVATEVAGWKMSGVRTMTCHQLTPELADPISTAARVIFVDAVGAFSKEVSLCEIAPAAPASGIMTHVVDPQILLRLAREVFGRCPKAWWLTVPVDNLDFGEKLSPLAQRGMEEALEKIRAMVGS